MYECVYIYRVYIEECPLFLGIRQWPIPHWPSLAVESAGAGHIRYIYIMYYAVPYINVYISCVYGRVLAAAFGIRRWPIPHWWWNRPVQDTLDTVSLSLICISAEYLYNICRTLLDVCVWKSEYSPPHLGIRQWPIPHWRWNRPARGTFDIFISCTMQCRVLMCIYIVCLWKSARCSWGSESGPYLTGSGIGRRGAHLIYAFLLCTAVYECVYISYVYGRVPAALGDQTLAHTSLAVESAGAGHI